jgi:hypothetical protein
MHPAVEEEKKLFYYGLYGFKVSAEAFDLLAEACDELLMLEMAAFRLEGGGVYYFATVTLMESVRARENKAEELEVPDAVMGRYRDRIVQITGEQPIYGCWGFKGECIRTVESYNRHLLDFAANAAPVDAVVAHE